MSEGPPHHSAERSRLGVYVVFGSAAHLGPSVTDTRGHEVRVMQERRGDRALTRRQVLPGRQNQLASC